MQETVIAGFFSIILALVYTIRQNFELLSKMSATATSIQVFQTKLEAIELWKDETDRLVKLLLYERDRDSGIRAAPTPPIGRFPHKKDDNA